jgi:nicotinate-nucleotide adenylyltransferase
MGGTFDPLHIGHLVAGSEAMHAFDLDRVTFVPTGRPWQKSEYSDQEDRYLMTLLGAESHPCFSVSRIELDRRGPTYTADTMQELHDFYGPEVELFFIAGADAILQLHTWERVDRLKDLTVMIAVSRPGFELGEFKAEIDWPRVQVMEMPGIDVSASEIRERVRSGHPIDFLVPAPVHEYIRKQGLYAS